MTLAAMTLPMAASTTTLLLMMLMMKEGSNFYDIILAVAPRFAGTGRNCGYMEG